MNDSLFEPFRTRPDRCAVLTDLDGTLAPIVARPQDARVPPATREVLAALAGRCALVACITGRRALDARRMVGVEALTYVGNQGFEELAPGADEPVAEVAVGSRARAAQEFAAGLDREHLAKAGLRLEDKGPVQVLHWRGAPDEESAERAAKQIAQDAQARGLVPLAGRKVVELRPVAGIDKGTAARRLLTAAAPLDAALFAGDDRTDLDAFRALAALAGGPRLGRAVRVGVGSEESPPEIAAEADVIVDGTEGVLAILRELEGSA